LDIGIKGSSYEGDKEIEKKEIEKEEEIEIYVNVNDETIIMKDDQNIENYYKIFKENTSLTLPIFKIVASYFYFVNLKWFKKLQNEGLLANKFTWARGTKHERKIFINFGLEEEHGKDISEWHLYWIVPERPQKKQRRICPLVSFQTISPGKSTRTFELSDKVNDKTADPDCCLSLSFLCRQNLPKTKIPRTFLRTLDLEFDSLPTRDRLFIFLRNFFWINKP